MVKNPLDTTISDRFKGVLNRAYEQTGQRAVVLIDEYDKPILDVLDTGAYLLDHVGDKRMLEDHHRELLAAFYSTFKGADEYLKFVLLTGVTTFSQESVFSGFNQPMDISMSEQYETLCGITQEELEDYFAEPLLKLAAKYKCSPEEMKAWLKRQYDGYHFSTNMADIYNPFSMLNAFQMNEIRDYWFSTGTPSYLIRLLQHSHENINELTGKYYEPALFVDYFKPKSKEISSWITNAVMDLDRGDTEAFRRSLTAFLSSIPYDSHDSLKEMDLTEKHFQYTFYLLLRLLGVYCLAIHCEDRQSYGRVDCTLEMEDYIYIFEFKLDGTARKALEQIEKMGYAQPYVADRRTVICIGVNFSSTTRTVEDWEEVKPY